MSDNVVFQNNPEIIDPPKNDHPLVKTENVEEVLTPQIAELIERYRLFLTTKRGVITPIHVDEIASKVAVLYENVRKIVDWKEENVLRRSAILRILKRSLISKITNLGLVFKVKAEHIAEPLVLELIRGGHLPNDEIPEEKISVVDKVLKKYIFLLENAPYEKTNHSFILKTKVNFYNFILEVASCEIEDVLAPPFTENELIRAMTHLLKKRIKIVPEEVINDKDKETQIYIAASRTLFDLDDSLITYHILRYQYQEWLDPSAQVLNSFTQNIFSIISHIEKQLMHPQRKEFINICEKVDTIFTILGDILGDYKKEPDKILAVVINKEKLKELIIKFYEKRYKTLKRRLFRLAILTSLSVIFSNFFTFFVIEVPLANIFYEGFNPFTTAVDFLIPPIIMFLLVIIIKPPAPKNLDELIKVTYKFIYLDSEIDNYEIKVKKKRRLFVEFFITLLYTLFAILFFGFTAWIFYVAKLPITSVIFDTFTIAINIFAAVTIRNKAKELSVQEKTSVWEFLLDIFSVPVAKVGSFFARKWKEYNVFSVFLNFFIEVPFITFIQFIESWSQFLKEKKAEIH